jgi:hypothetical protein
MKLLVIYHDIIITTRNRPVRRTSRLISGDDGSIFIIVTRPSSLPAPPADDSLYTIYIVVVHTPSLGIILHL